MASVDRVHLSKHRFPGQSSVIRFLEFLCSQSSSSFLPLDSQKLISENEERMDVKPGIGGTLVWVYRKIFMLDKEVEAQKAEVHCLREEVRGNKAAADNRVNQQAIAVLHQTRNESHNLHSMLTRTVHDSEVKLNKEISLLRAEVNKIRGVLATQGKSTSAGWVNCGVSMQPEPTSIVSPPNSPAGDLSEAIQTMFVASPAVANAEAAPPEHYWRKATIKSDRVNCPQCGKNLSKRYLPIHIRRSCPQREMMK